MSARAPAVALAALVAVGALGLAAFAQDSPGAAPPSPSAAPSTPSRTDERLKAIRERRQRLEEDLARLRGEEKSLLGEVEQLELEVRLRTEQLRETQAVLVRANEELEATTARTQRLQKSLADARPVLAARARALYKLGELSYMRMLLSVEGPAEIFRGYRFVSALARNDKQRVAGFRRDLTDLGTAQRDLERRTQEALVLRAELVRMRRALDSDRRRKSALLTSLVEKKETNVAYLAELEQAETRLGQMIAGLGSGDVAVPVAAFRGSLPWPATGRVRTGFGRHKHPRFDTYTVQNGIDIAAPLDAPVAAVHEGTVAFADAFRGYGLMVVIDHGDKYHTLYAHLGEAKVRPGQRVAAGEVIGTVGASGVAGPGVYFEVRGQGKPQDPMEWLARP